MKIFHTVVGEIGTNCYLLLDETTHCAALIDPGDEAERLEALLAEHNADLRAIFLTHGHYDHVGAVAELLKKHPDIPVYLHPYDAVAPSRLFPLCAAVVPHNYRDGDTVLLGSLCVRVYHTPGHSRGSVTLHVENALFTGDTLFFGSCGRVDLDGGDEEQMMRSLARLAALDGDADVYPGHMNFSTLEAERRNNPYMRYVAKGTV